MCPALTCVAVYPVFVKCLCANNAHRFLNFSRCFSTGVTLFSLLTCRLYFVLWRNKLILSSTFFVLIKSVISTNSLCSQVSQYVICDGRSGTGTDFSPSSSVLSCLNHFTMAVHTHISPVRWTIGPLVAAIHRHSLIPSTWTTICPL
jgi:hypothetical protein